MLNFIICSAIFFVLAVCVFVMEKRDGNDTSEAFASAILFTVIAYLPFCLIYKVVVTAVVKIFGL